MITWKKHIGAHGYICYAALVGKNLETTLGLYPCNRGFALEVNGKIVKRGSLALLKAYASMHYNNRNTTEQES